MEVWGATSRRSDSATPAIAATCSTVDMALRLVRALNGPLRSSHALGSSPATPPRSRPRLVGYTSPRGCADPLTCAMGFTARPVENDPADSECSLPHLPAFADRLAAGHREESRRRRCGGGPGPQGRRFRAVRQVAENTAHQLAAAPVVAAFRRNRPDLQLR